MQERQQEKFQNKELSLLDILDVILDKGVAIRGDLIISIADIDLVYIDLRVLITSVETMIQSRENRGKERVDDGTRNRLPAAAGHGFR